MANQLSGVVFENLAMRNAMSADSARFSRSNSDTVNRLTPSRRASSLCDMRSAGSMSSRNTSPGCVGRRLVWLDATCIASLKEPFKPFVLKAYNHKL